MPHAYQETEPEQFACPRLGDTISVDITYHHIQLPNGGTKSVRTGFGCEYRRECGVSSVSPDGRVETPDWTKCAHPYHQKR